MLTQIVATAVSRATQQPAATDTASAMPTRVLHYVYTFTFFSLFCIFIGRGGKTFIFIELQSRNGLIV